MEWKKLKQPRQMSIHLQRFYGGRYFVCYFERGLAPSSSAPDSEWSRVCAG